MNAPARPQIDLLPGLEGIRAEIPASRYPPGYLYNSDAVAALEKSRIFLRQWLCIARVEEVAKPGDYLTMRIADESIVLSRAADGTLHAFRNRCLHRGVEIAYGAGNAKRHHCPYHAWAYDSAGRLLGAPLFKPDDLAAAGLPPEKCRLPPLRLAEWRGWVFVNFDERAEAFADYIAPFERELWFYRTGECRMATKIRFEVNCNWKYLAENILDYYHLGVIHVGTMGRLFKLGRDPLPVKLFANGGGVVEFSTAMRASDPNLPFPPLPWLAERPDFLSAKGMMFPNVNFWCGTDSLRMWHLWPDGTGRTVAHFYMLLPEASFAVPGFDAKIEKYREYVSAIVAEDKVALESLQAASHSRDFEPGPMTNLEAMIRHLLNRYADVMLGA